MDKVDRMNGYKVVLEEHDRLWSAIVAGDARTEYLKGVYTIGKYPLFFFEGEGGAQLFFRGFSTLRKQLWRAECLGVQPAPKRIIPVFFEDALLEKGLADFWSRYQDLYYLYRGTAPVGTLIADQIMLTERVS